MEYLNVFILAEPKSNTLKEKVHKDLNFFKYLES